MAIKKQGGFTLLEIMGTVLIVGFLSVLAGVYFTGYTKECRLTEALEMIGGIEKSQKYNYMLRNKFFDANTPAQFSVYGIDISDADKFRYESASGPEKCVIRADSLDGEGWLELHIKIDGADSWKCDGNYITPDMLHKES